MDEFIKSINLDFLEMGVTKQFTDQIKNLAFVYAFDEAQMAGLYNESINKLKARISEIETELTKDR